MRSFVNGKESYSKLALATNVVIVKCYGGISKKEDDGNDYRYVFIALKIISVVLILVIELIVPHLLIAGTGGLRFVRQ